MKIQLQKSLDHSYKITIKNGCSLEIPNYLNKEKLGKKYAIITDNKVNKLYGKKFQNLLKSAGINSEIFHFPNGEKSKNLSTIEKLSSSMIEKGFDRQDAIIALGGGVPGDIAGFLASIYMRGIPFIQVPTTLLAMVDSSVGGKTGVDTNCGKNLLGTFNQPKAVFIDSEYLQTLSPKQIRSGLAEVIKYGVIKSKSLFEYLEENIEKVFTLDQKVVNKIIEQSVNIKAQVVQNDEKEQGQRMILNYGHTYGHAIEHMSGYKLLHGYAIAIGMVIINKIAVEKGLLKESDAERIKTLIKSAGLPTKTMKTPSNQDLQKDKKKQGNKIKLILATKIGEVTIIEEPCL